MQNHEGMIGEIFYTKTGLAGTLRCLPGLVPRPGQYVMAVSLAADRQPVEVTATPLFSTRNLPDGFAFAAPIPETWKPGTRIAARGPIGHGFQVPSLSKRVALVGFRNSASRLLSLLQETMERNAEITFICDEPPSDLPEEIEIQPQAALPEVCAWADFIAVETTRESLVDVKELLRAPGFKAEIQILVRAPMPCGALAECGACAITTGEGWKMVCKDGPVFGFRELR